MRLVRNVGGSAEAEGDVKRRAISRGGGKDRGRKSCYGQQVVALKDG